MQWFYEAGATLFIRAAVERHALMRLPDYGADLFAATGNGDTALTYAAASVGWKASATSAHRRKI
jgi:hypothetical protein